MRSVIAGAASGDSLPVPPNGTNIGLQGKLRALQARLDTADSLTIGQNALVLALAALLIFSRDPSMLLHPQFYGEDGMIWYPQAYELGWFHALTIPYAGYLSSLQRLAAGVALLVPFHLAPLVMTLIGFAFQCLPVPVLLSARCRDWGPLSLRAFWALIYVALPNTQEVHVNLTNSQWHLPLAVLLVSFGRPPTSTLWKVFDIVAFTLMGLTGPYCLLFLPLLCGFWWVTRRQWTKVQIALTAVCCAAQLWFLHFPGRTTTPLGASLQSGVRIFGGNVICGTLLGGNHEMGTKPLPFLLFAAIFGVMVFGFALTHAPLQLKLLTIFALLLLAASLKSPLVAGPVRWQTLITSAAARYWFIPMLAFMWCLAWCWQLAPNKYMRRAAAVWLCVSVIGAVTGWRLMPSPNVNFPAYAAQFEMARAGTVMTIPEAPSPGFVLTICKH